jgi:beta-glucanase (GH16 family)
MRIPFFYKTYIPHTTFVLSMVLVLLCISCNEDETQTVTTFTKVTFEDNFDTDGPIDPAAWTAEIGTGNIKVEGGMLHITALQESFQGSPYTSARITTKGKVEQKYGRFEARIKLPWGQGLWPAFWLLGANIEQVEDSDPGTLVWPACGEIDIMEYRGQQPTILNGSIHGPGYSGGEAITKAYDLVNDRFDTDFHIFGIEWGPEYINFYVDDVLYNQITPDDLPDGPEPDWVNELYPEPEYDNLWNKWAFDDQPFFIIINLAVGGSFVGSPNANTVFPQTMLVDWVKVYEGDQ